MAEILNMNCSPIVIGAVGGSGTRVFAEILQKSGVFIGNQLNGPLDNLLFSRLFRIPEYYNIEVDDFFYKRISLFEKLMTGKVISIKDFFVLLKCNSKNIYYKNDFTHLYTTLRTRNNNKIWGWKAPGSQLYIKHLHSYWPNFKYIHIVRDGFDMAFSENDNQLKIWGYLFGLNYNPNQSIHSQLLRYWYEANMKVMLEAKELLSENAMIIKFEDFISEPDLGVKALMNFLNIQVSDEKLKELSNLVKTPKSCGRAKNKMDLFSENDLLFVDKINQIIS